MSEEEKYTTILEYFKGRKDFPGNHFQIISLEINDNLTKEINNGDSVVYLLAYFSGDRMSKTETLNSYNFSRNKIVKKEINSHKILDPTNQLACKLGDLGKRPECDDFFYDNNICIMSLGGVSKNMQETLKNCLRITEIPSVSF